MNAEVFERLGVMLAMISLGALLYRLPIWQLQRAPDAGALGNSDAAPGNTDSAPRPAPDAIVAHPGAAAAHSLAQLLTFALIPALLFRTLQRLDISQMPWTAVQGYFAPVLASILIAHWAFSRRPAPAQVSFPAALAAPATRATAAIYGNAVLLGIPLAAGLFGEKGLAIHLAVVSLHSLLALTLLTVLAEWSVARGTEPHLRGTGHWHTVTQLPLKALWHPVVLPIVLGLAYNLLGWPMPTWLDAVLAALGSATMPLSLLLIGMSLVQFGVRDNWREALPQVIFKLLVLPCAVAWVAREAFGLRGLPLQVLVMMAALPVGTNALIFAHRYRLLQAEASTAIVMSTLAFVLTAPLWLWALQWLA